MFLFKRKNKFDEQIRQDELARKRLAELEAQRAKLEPEWTRLAGESEASFNAAAAAESMASLADQSLNQPVYLRLRARASLLQAQLAAKQNERDALISELDRQIRETKNAVDARNGAIVDRIATWIQKVRRSTENPDLISYLERTGKTVASMRGDPLRAIFDAASELVKKLESDEAFDLPFSLDAALQPKTRTEHEAAFELRDLTPQTSDGRVTVATFRDAPGTEPILR